MERNKERKDRSEEDESYSTVHVLLTNESKRDRERERKWNGVKKEKTE